jgi:ketosteroid isomerase-like protein
VRFLVILSIVTLGCINAGRTQSSVQPSSDVAAIHRLDSLWAQMYARHDTVLARSLYAEDLVFTSANGNQKNREQELADVRPQPGLVMDYFRTTPTQVRVHEGAAVVTGTAEWRFTWNGQTREVNRGYTIMYARGGPLGWRILAVHMGATRP